MNECMSVSGGPALYRYINGATLSSMKGPTFHRWLVLVCIHAIWDTARVRSSKGLKGSYFIFCVAMVIFIKMCI